VDDSRLLRGQLSVADSSCERGDDLGHRQVGGEEVVAPLECSVEVVAAGSGK
jgi:hypothetical protein